MLKIVLTLDNVLKTAQICFYITASIITILTYRSAKNGLLNAVNTEYQKKVINKLEEISIELGSEFDPLSPNYWANYNPIRESVSEINDVFERNKEYILELGEYPFGTVLPSNIKRLRTFIARIKSDPFTPKEIREVILAFLERRSQIVMSIYSNELESYAQLLVNGERLLKTNGEDSKFDEFHNSIIEKLNFEKCGISAIEAEVNKIRSYIQLYLESFNPVKRKGIIPFQ
jgi:hypothetical protein